MPRDRYAVLRFLVALYFLLVFSLIGLHARLSDQRHGHAVERAHIAPVTFASRWP